MLFLCSEIPGVAEAFLGLGLRVGILRFSAFIAGSETCGKCAAHNFS